jgi:hypothetical protein
VNALARRAAQVAGILGRLVIAVVLATLMVKFLYGTAIGRWMLDSVPNAAWEAAHRGLSVTLQNGIEDRQDADALIVFAACAVACILFAFIIEYAASRTSGKRARTTHSQPNSREPDGDGR